MRHDVDPAEWTATAAELCARWGIGKRQLANLERRGLPCTGTRTRKRYHPAADVWRAEHGRLVALARRGWQSRDGARSLRKPPGWPVLPMRLALARAELRGAIREAREAAPQMREERAS